MTTRLTNLPTPFTFQFNVTASGTPESLNVKKRATTIAFNANDPSADTITDSGNGFLTAGFQAGDHITVSGSASNDGTYTVAAVTAGTITLIPTDALVTEAAGATVKMIAPKDVPDGISVSVKAKNANGGTIHVGYSTESALNTGGGSFTLGNNETLSLQVSNINKIWLDSTVSGEGVEVVFEKNVQG